MNPEQAMVGRRRCQNSFRLPEIAVDLFKPSQETGDGSGTWGNIPSHFDVAFAQAPGDDGQFFFGLRGRAGDVPAIRCAGTVSQGRRPAGETRSQQTRMATNMPNLLF